MGSGDPWRCDFQALRKDGDTKLFVRVNKEQKVHRRTALLYHCLETCDFWGCYCVYCHEGIPYPQMINSTSQSFAIISIKLLPGFCNDLLQVQQLLDPSQLLGVIPQRNLEVIDFQLVSWCSYPRSLKALHHQFHVKQMKSESYHLVYVFRHDVFE